MVSPPYRLVTDGDGEERPAWEEFLELEFPEYESFWLAAVVALTARPAGVHLLADQDLPDGFTAEDVAIAQLHYTVMKNLRRAHACRVLPTVDDYVLSLGLSFLVAAQDVAFELLQRRQKPGSYHPWKESHENGRDDSGQDARNAWKKAAEYPLSWIREYRNKLLHGRTPPALDGLLPKPECLDRYTDWRKVTASDAREDFQEPREILQLAWQETIDYFRRAWRDSLDVHGG